MFDWFLVVGLFVCTLVFDCGSCICWFFVICCVGMILPLYWLVVAPRRLVVCAAGAVVGC